MGRLRTAEECSRNSELFGEVFGQETQKKCLPEKLRDIAHAQASHEIEPMHFDRSDADVQAASDFTIGHPLSHEAKDFLLTRREGMRRSRSIGERASFHFRYSA
jgi:hypothetical protein